MASQNLYRVLGLIALVVLINRMDSKAQMAGARNRRLALFRNDICYINRFSSAPPVLDGSAACQVASDQGKSVAFQQFEQDLQRDAALKAQAEQTLQQLRPGLRARLINDLRYLNRINRRDYPDQPSAPQTDGW